MNFTIAHNHSQITISLHHKLVNNKQTTYAYKTNLLYTGNNKVYSFYTKGRQPWKLIYYEANLTENDAKARERSLKSGMGKRYLKNRLPLFFDQKSS